MLKAQVFHTSNNECSSKLLSSSDTLSTSLATLKTDLQNICRISCKDSENTSSWPS